MAIEGNHDPLERARTAAREDQPDGWIELSESIMTRVRAIVTPAEPVLTFADGGATDRDDVGSRTMVSTRIINAALRRALRQPTHASEDIALTVAEERLVAVDLKLVCSYGVDLHELAETIRGEVFGEIVDMLGPDPDFTPARISIDFVDVVDGNPNLV